jgi:hypothetical protein
VIPTGKKELVQKPLTKNANENTNSQILIDVFSVFFTYKKYEQLMQQLHKCIRLQMTAKRIHLLRVGWRNFFSSCAVVSVFWLWWEIVLGVTYVLRVQYSCCVVLVFWFWREIVFGFAYVLSVHYSCAVVSVFWFWRERNSHVI